MTQQFSSHDWPYKNFASSCISVDTIHTYCIRTTFTKLINFVFVKIHILPVHRLYFEFILTLLFFLNGVYLSVTLQICIYLTV
jgi:hypothetical protein